MKKLAVLLALSACATAPGDDLDSDGDGKADAAVLKKRRRLRSGVTCPEGDAKFKIAFFDADSTLRVSKSGAVTADSATDVNVLPFAARELARLDEEGYVIAVVSNQGGVGSGHQTFATAEQALALAISKLDVLGGPVHYFDFAEKYDHYRKPEIGMAELLDSKLETKCGVGFDRATSFMVGDSGYKKGVDGPHPDGRPADDFSNSDRLFAKNLGVDFHEPTDYFRWRDYDVFNIASQAELIGLLDAIEARAAELADMGGDPEEIEALEREASDNRRVNEL
ncbi:MAG TPA: HAD-IIIA family hydrolase [Kofleriaceae bacterium]